MRRRSKASSKLARARSRKAKTLKAVRHSSSSGGGEETELARFRRERDEALEREIATSVVLRLISESPGDLELVFRSILENATRICDAEFGTLLRFDGSAFQLAAQVGTPVEYAEFLNRRGPFLPPPGTNLDRVVRTKRVSSGVDRTADPVPGPAARLGGARSHLNVPMLKGNVLIGVITIYRQDATLHQ